MEGDWTNIQLHSHVVNQISSMPASQAGNNVMLPIRAMIRAVFCFLLACSDKTTAS